MTDLFDVANTPCPRCKTYGTLFGWLYRDETGKHQHTRYACTRWPCKWIGWNALPEENPMSTTPETTETAAEHMEPMLQFFEFGHLPEHLQIISEPFSVLAHELVNGLPRNPERTTALRKLLEAKDSAVRALLFR